MKLLKPALAEFAGTGLLVAVVVGSGIMGSFLSASNIGVALLINALSTAFALALLINILGPVSGAHFNPAVSFVQWLQRSISAAQLLVYVAAQTAGAIAGAILANVMFNTPALQIAQQQRVNPGVLVAEVVATAGLIVVIGVLSARKQGNLIPVAVATFIGSAYFFTSSTSFANPAVTVGRIFSNTFAGIAPEAVVPFIGAQLVGALVGLGLVRALVGPASKALAPKPSVLFVCVHNAGKSQMAAALMRAKAGNAVTVYSAGTHPGEALNTEAQLAVAQLGVSMAGESPKAITDEIFTTVDRIVILGNEAKLAWVPGMAGTIEAWLTPEVGAEVGDKLAQTVIVRDDIAKRVDRLFTELTK